MAQQPTKKRSTDRYGRARKGSQRQVQIYVNRRRKELDEACLKALPSLAVRDPRLRWVSPLETSRFKEYYDRDFLSAVGCKPLVPLLRQFWPDRGPHWDALAVVDSPATRPGVLLVEGKSYPRELRGSGMKATSDASKKKIRHALQATQQWLVVPEANWAAWEKRLYQSANRLAHLYWMRQVAGVDAWLLHLLFTGDDTHPTTEQEWESAMTEADTELGLNDVIVPHTGHVCLESRESKELVLPPAEVGEGSG